MFTTKLRVKMPTHNFLDKLEMTLRAVISRVNSFQKMQYKMT